jgi:hypothetical protein
MQASRLWTPSPALRRVNAGQRTAGVYPREHAGVDWLEFLAGAAHVVVAAVWLGAMAYSLAIVQPRVARFLGDERRTEELAAVLAAGARRKVLAVMAVLAISGAVLVLAAPEGERSGGWWALIAVKAVLLAVALAVFAHVSWRLWPARLFAGDEELPGVRRRFRFAAIALIGLVATGTVLGVAASALR